MAHVRTLIRHTFINLLDTGLAPDVYRVLGTRSSQVNRVEDDMRSLVDVRFTDIRIEQETMGDDRLHTGTLMIRVQRIGEDETLDDDLDADEVVISGIVNDFSWDSLLEDEPELQQVTFARDSESEQFVGVIILRYQVVYRIDKRNPEVVRD